MARNILLWWPVVLLTLTAFILNTSEFVPVGLLTSIGKSFGMSAIDVGPIMTIYATVVALTSLPATLLFAQYERSRLLLGVMAVFIVSHWVCTIAPSYSALVLGRIGVAFAHALFWAITPAIAIRLAPKGKKATALSLLSTGVVLASALGIPLGRIIDQFQGWRSSFAVIALASMMLTFALWRNLHRLPAEHGGSWQSLPHLLRNQSLVWVYVLTVLLITAHYSVYTYLEPLLQQHLDYEPYITTLVLLSFGGGGVLGSVLFSRYQGNHGILLFVLPVITLGFCVMVLTVPGDSPWLMIMICLMWGTAFILICLSLQFHYLKLAPEATDVAMAIYSGLHNVGIGAGALLGNILADRFGVEYNGSMAILLILASAVPLLYLFRIPPLKDTGWH